MQNIEFFFTAKISSNGRVIIPAVLREALELDDGDIVELKLVRIVKRAKEGVKI